MKALTVKIGVGLAVSVGLLLVNTPAAYATDPCPQDDCYTNTCAIYSTKLFKPMYDLHPNGDPVPDPAPFCRDCDGVAEEADGRDHGVCIKNYYDFQTLYFKVWDIAHAAYTTECYIKEPVHKGLECGRSPAG